MRADEADAVSALLLEANADHLAQFPPAVARGYRKHLADVSALLSTASVLVAERAAEMVGTVTLLRDAADDTHPWPSGGSVLRLLAVAPAARGAGIGRLLSTACIDSARAAGASYVGLHTSPFMASARSLYERLGFVRAPEHDFDPGLHYGDGGTSAEPWGLAYVLEM